MEMKNEVQGGNAIIDLFLLLFIYFFSVLAS